MEFSVYPDVETMSHEAARSIVQMANEAVVTHGRFSIALSGGSTPKLLYGLLAQEPYRSQINWSTVEIFWSDERCVPPDDKESNFHLAREVLLSKAPLEEKQIHRMPADAVEREAASRAYTLEIQRVLGVEGTPRFDLLQLGMGPEGHTASLFPHQTSLHEGRRLVMPVSVPKPPPDRLTFTPPMLNAARRVLFLVAGAEKADAVRAALEGEDNVDEYPAQMMRRNRGEVIWMLDTAAAQQLQRR